MAQTDDRTLPAVLADVTGTGFDYDDGEGVDFEPFDGFLDAEETTGWMRAWTGNAELDGDAFRVFGQDGTGGYAAFWLIRPGAELTGQPIVFFGSEGAVGVVARDLASYLWLLADGFGPLEAVEYPERDPRRNEEFAAIAERFAPGTRRSGRAVIDEARKEFPGFERTVEELCR